MRKSVTEPDDSPFTASRTKPKASRHQGSSIYYVGRVIKEVDEKESPRIKKSEKQRTKEEFLVSVKNWQERKKLKQE